MEDRTWRSFVWGRKWLGLESRSKLTWFLCRGHRNWLVSFAGVKIDILFVCGPKLLGFNVWIKIDSVFVCGPKMTSFILVQGSIDMVFVWVVEIDLVFVRGSENHLFQCEHQNWLVVLCGWSKLSWFQWWGRTSLGLHVRDRNWLGFSFGIELDLFFVRGWKSTLVLCAGRKFLGFNLWIKIDSVFVCGPKMTCF